eukprot:CAMPEP_0113486032 /NCGR_PEP_ID=MMETSP0014_2-20120614/24788_1 /TAXON_ID=2857 /ORGANISM="Nitzschia sp." /LENGTH=431 /DNA_ID=CAMNT_0000379693 /DNA_START=69 /DNA_END=1361 /DNA_ORIENTATION=- /assembly_acc=CAM_ASM_000159
MTVTVETTEASKADRGGSHEYDHEQQLKPHPLLHPLQLNSQEVNGQDQHHLHFHHPHPHPFVAYERSAEHHQRHHHLHYQELHQQQQQQQQGDHEHKYDDKTDAELQEDEDFINKLAEATMQRELIEGGVATNKDATVVEPVGVDENHPCPPPSRVCTDSDGDDPAAAVVAAGDDLTSNSSSTMDTTAQEHAATLLHAVSASNIALGHDELSTETAGSAAAAAIATAAAATSSTSADRPIMETETHSDHPRYEVGQHDTIGLLIGEKVTTSAAATTAATSTVHLECEKPRPVPTELSDTATTNSSSLVGGRTEPIPGVAKNEAIPASGAQAVSAKKGVGKVGSKSHEGTQYKTGRWTVEEKIIFLHLLRRFGRGKWKNYQPYLPFRSIVQIKSHAQKVLKRQAKGDDIYLQLDEVQLTVEQLMEHVRRGDT